MSDYIRTDLKIKQQDGSFKKYSPTVTLDSVIIDDKTLSDILTDGGAVFKGTASNVEWKGVLNKPTTIEGYGITDAVSTTQFTSHVNNKNNPHAVDKEDVGLGNVDNTSDLNKPISTATQTALNNKVNTSDVTTTATANKLLKLDDNAKLPASILSGTIPIENLPHGALERCVIVEDDDARFALTTSQVQTGDTVKVRNTGLMYFVKDQTKLNSENGYEVYVAGSAATVPWIGVTSRPTTLSGYGITDAVNSSDVVTSPAPNKLLKLDSSGKLPIASIPQHIEITTYTSADI